MNVAASIKLATHSNKLMLFSELCFCKIKKKGGWEAVSGAWKGELPLSQLTPNLQHVRDVCVHPEMTTKCSSPRVM